MKIDPTRVKITTAPVSEPVTLAEAKLHCRIDHDDEDDLLDRVIAVARQQCEDIARRPFVTRTYTVNLDCWPYGGSWEFPYPPLAGVTSVKYTDQDGNQSAFASSNYIVDTYREPGRLVLKSTASWPSVTLADINGIEIIFTAGYGDSGDVPDRYKQAMLLLIGHFYENRESVVVQQGVSLVQIPQAVDWLLMTDRAF